jgi:hypothetical protein
MNQPGFSVLASASSTTNENSLRPFHGYSKVQQFMSAATSNYHALQVQLSRRAGNVTFTAAYTLSKVLGNWMYGPLSYDANHVFTGSFVWDLPKLRSQPAFIRAPSGNWQFSGICSPAVWVRRQHYREYGNCRRPGSDYIGGSTMLPNPGPDGWFNPAAFAPAPQDRLGIRARATYGSLA